MSFKQQLIKMDQSYYIKARDLDDAWFKTIELLLKYGSKIPIDFGSYEGQVRLQLPYFTIEILYPGTRPLAPIVPHHIEPPATMEYIEEYLGYLMIASPLKCEEQYTYGSRIELQMATIIDNYLKFGFNTNQACISVSQPGDIFLEDPPCLRNISMMINGDPQELHFYVYFRSWDAWCGFPVNLGGIRLMQEYMSERIGVNPGRIIAASNGLHIYDHVWDMAKSLVVG